MWQLVEMMEAKKPAPKISAAAASAAATAAASGKGSAATSDPSKVNLVIVVVIRLHTFFLSHTPQSTHPNPHPAQVFDRHQGIAAKMSIQNIDTDMIIPKQVRRVTRSVCGRGVGHALEGRSGWL